MMKLLTIFGKPGAVVHLESFIWRLFPSIVIACVCLLDVSAQELSPQNRQICEQLNRQCLLEQNRLGRRDDITRSVDQQCRRRDSGWRRISRCELERATCISECTINLLKSFNFIFTIYLKSFWVVVDPLPARKSPGYCVVKTHMNI